LNIGIDEGFDDEFIKGIFQIQNGDAHAQVFCNPLRGGQLGFAFCGRCGQQKVETVHLPSPLLEKCGSERTVNPAAQSDDNC